MTEQDDELPDGERGVGEVLSVVAIIFVEYGLGGALGNLVYDAPRQLIRTLRPGHADRRPGKPLTKDEAIEWAACLVEAKYLSAITSAGRPPTYRVLSWLHADQTWTVELDYLDAGIFEIRLSEAEGPMPEASVGWRRQSPQALASHDPGQPPSTAGPDVRSIQIGGLMARIRFALRGRLVPPDQEP